MVIPSNTTLFLVITTSSKHSILEPRNGVPDILEMQRVYNQRVQGWVPRGGNARKHAQPKKKKGKKGEKAKSENKAGQPATTASGDISAALTPIMRTKRAALGTQCRIIHSLALAAAPPARHRRTYSINKNIDQMIDVGRSSLAGMLLSSTCLLWSLE